MASKRADLRIFGAGGHIERFILAGDRKMVDLQPKRGKVDRLLDMQSICC
jgi:hypothetical protein